MQLSVLDVVAETDRRDLHDLYIRAMATLSTRAAARHELTLEEFDREMGDPRLLKLLVQDEGGRTVGLSTLASDLAAVEWINPQLFRDRFPEEDRRGALLYVGFLVVDPQAPRSNALMRMTSEISRRASSVGGVVGLDMCGYNLEHGVGRWLVQLLRPKNIGPVDTQTYLVADFRPDATASVAAGPSSTTDAGSSPEMQLVPATARPGYLEDAGPLLTSRWPAFVLAGEAGHGHDLTAVVGRHPGLQVVAVDATDRLGGVAFSLPIRWDGTTEDLPSGWDDAVRRSADLDDGDADTACALSVTVAHGAAGKGLSRRLVAALRDAARAAGYKALLAPVRPVLKEHYPLVPMAEYLTWQTASGEAFDPWVRLHLQVGGTVLGVAEASMVIRGGRPDWERWTGLAMPGPGTFVVPGGLAPVVVDATTGTYTEPNVWVLHRT